MRWLTVAILAYVCLVAETTLFRPGVLALKVGPHVVQPELLLVLGVFVALTYEPREVFFAGWAMGLASDLAAPYGRLGVRALVFAVVLWLVSYLQGNVFRTRVVIQFLLCLVIVFVVRWTWDLAARYVLGAPLLVGHSARGAALAALYSAILAPYLFWLFFRLRGPLRLPPGTALD